MRIYEMIFVFLFVVTSIIGAGQGAFEFGINLASGPLSKGDIVSNDYTGFGGWYDNTVHCPPNPYSVEEMVASWNMRSVWQSGFNGFAGYWFSDRIAMRLDAKYGTVSSAVSGVFLDWTTCSLGTNYEDHSREFEACNEKGKIATASANIAAQIRLIKGDDFDVSVLLGPAVFFDKFEMYLDLPIAITSDYEDTVCKYYVSSAVVSDPLKYEGSETTIGASGALLARFDLSSRVFLEGNLYFDLGAMPVYSVEKYELTSDQEYVDLSELSIKSETKGFLRGWGLGIGMGFELAKPGHKEDL